MTTDPTRNARQQRWRDRQAGKLPPAPRVVCIACGKIHTGAKGAHCSRCWQSLTPEGRLDRAARVRKARTAKRDNVQRDQPHSGSASVMM